MSKVRDIILFPIYPKGFTTQAIKESFGWLGLFLIVSAWGFVALLATWFYPYKPR